MATRLSSSAQLNSSASSPSRGPPRYYSSTLNRPTLTPEFRDVDLPDVHREYSQTLHAPHTRNFLVDFGSEQAWAATNLEADDIKSLLDKKRPKELGTRWINFWGVEKDKDAIKAIAAHYELSTRLQGLLLSAAVGDANRELSSSDKQPVRKRHPLSQPNGQLTSEKSVDVEAAVSSSAINATPGQTPGLDVRNVKFRDVHREIWHFSTVDSGKRFFCLGYNSLFAMPNQRANTSNKPDGKRIWSWLLVCDDGTVVSIYENPFPQSAPDLQILRTVRTHVVTIFEHLSTACPTNPNMDSLATVQVRRLADAHPSTSDNGFASSMEPASLLLYYLFDDWVMSYRLVARIDHPYGGRLEAIRQEMSERAEVPLVAQLHDLGRQLAVLKRMYQSYELIINRILLRQKAIRAEAQQAMQHNPGLQYVQMTDDHHDLAIEDHLPRSWSMMPTSSEDGSLGPRLSQSALVRFERLLDRIRLYALSEIEECLKEKEDLVFMNFNLIALKEAQAVEKLTRNTILLAKATIVFLPVSLMTGYFSVQIADLQNVYTAKTYWLCFLVIVVLTLLLLVLYGYATGTVEGKTTYKSLGRTVFDRLRRKQQKRRQ